jgi:hypothetical protein
MEPHIVEQYVLSTGVFSNGLGDAMEWYLRKYL